MSHRFDLRCRDCGEDCGFSLNRDHETLEQLWKQRDAWASLGAALVEHPLRYDSLELSMYGDESGGMGCLPAFALKHRDHDVLPYDEYGVYLDQCDRWVDCGECQHSKRCGLDRHHEGDCRPEGAKA